MQLESETTDAREPLPFFAVSTFKFATLCLCTLGLYQIYWCYKSWECIAERSTKTIRPIWRTIFALFWNFSLLRTICEQVEARGIEVRWSPGVLATVFMLLTFTGRFPQPWWTLALLNFVPLLPIVRTIRSVNVTVAPTDELNESFSKANIACAVVGGLMLVLGLSGTFLVKIPTAN